VLEGDGKIDIVRFLRKLDRKYGKNNKISFAIIGGHGTWDSIQFGGTDPKHSLRMYDLWDKKHPASKRKKYFVDNPTFILVSCSTGAQYGIAEQLSDEMGATVIAPDEPTNINSIRATIKDDGKISFAVEYVKKETTQVYVGGKRR